LEIHFFFRDPNSFFLYSIIENYTRESGVRDLERKIANVLRKSITEMLEKDKNIGNITINHIRKYLGPTQFTYEKIDRIEKIYRISNKGS